MGGRPKGLLLAPSGETIVARYARLFAGLSVPCVLVGKHGAYAHLGLEGLADVGEVEAAGPIGGLLALLAHGPHVLAIACDMPHVSKGLLSRLIDAPPAPAVAARRSGKWEPFFARYDAAEVLPVARAHVRAGKLSLQALLDAVGARELILDTAEAGELHDWDAPEDVRDEVDELV